MFKRNGVDLCLPWVKTNYTCLLSLSICLSLFVSFCLFLIPSPSLFLSLPSPSYSPISISLSTSFPIALSRNQSPLFLPLVSPQAPPFPSLTTLGAIALRTPLSQTLRAGLDWYSQRSRLRPLPRQPQLPHLPSHEQGSAALDFLSPLVYLWYTTEPGTVCYAYIHSTIVTIFGTSLCCAGLTGIYMYIYLYHS